ncbi:MAG: hypothetical protein V1912_04825 [bacterium]
MAAVVAAVGYGAYFLYGALQSEQPVILITDPATTQSVPTSTTASTPTTIAEERFDFQGLWAGNVKTVPEHPVSLSSEFFVRPVSPAELVMPTPLWIFANDLTPEEVAQAVDAAAEDQPVFVFLPTTAAEDALSIPADDLLARFEQMGELSPVFTATPVLVRYKPFVEVEAHWNCSWVDLGQGTETGANVDPDQAYAAAAALTMILEGNARVTAENKAAILEAENGGSTTSTSDSEGISLYPQFEQVPSSQAEQLASDAAAYLRSITGLEFGMKDALEMQWIYENHEVRVRQHIGQLEVAGTAGRVGYSVSWSAQDQLRPFTKLLGEHAMRPFGWFDGGQEVEGIILAHDVGYQAILQLPNGVTANVDSIGQNQLPRLSPAETSLITPEQLIELAKWLVVQAEYLHP